MELLLTTGEIVIVNRPLSRTYDGDVLSNSRQILLTRQNERHEAEFWSRMPGSGRVRFYKLLRQINDRATGDLFDHELIYIDREALPKNPDDERSICSEFGVDLKRTMNRLTAKAGGLDSIEDGSPLDESLLARFKWLSLARKIILARAGFPEIFEPWAP